MVKWCGNINTKEDFLEGIWWPIFLKMDLELWIFLLSLLFNESNSLKGHLSNLSFPYGKLGFLKIYNNFIMITCKRLVWFKVSCL